VRKMRLISLLFHIDGWVN